MNKDDECEIVKDLSYKELDVLSNDIRNYLLEICWNWDLKMIHYHKKRGFLICTKFLHYHIKVLNY